ncbi:MAG: hypothetical protein KME64_26255 [Scytonematopsis contorta HA4267-MV1]|nr:hypothetical protein [Scytonematopsis contorta HA4267-MV1]
MKSQNVNLLNGFEATELSHDQMEVITGGTTFTFPTVPGDVRISPGMPGIVITSPGTLTWVNPNPAQTPITIVTK